MLFGYKSLDLEAGLKLNWALDRHGRYWQIDNPRFLVAWKGIKMRCDKTVLFVYRTLS